MTEADLSQSVAMTVCGTFAIIGSAGGSIDVFNLQSGIHRQRFPAKLNAAQVKALRLKQASGEVTGRKSKTEFGEGRHTKAVTGVMVDSLNRTLVSCGLDGKLKFWDFVTGQLIDELDWFPMSCITGLRFNGSSDLIALSCDDLSIRVVDVETRKLVRELWGCVGQINDFCFSNDGRWIIAASMDSTVRIWDLPTGHLIDAVRMESACTNLAFSSTGQFFATAHADGVGINIWNNRTLFTYIPTQHIHEEEITDIAQPTATGEGGHGMIDAAFEEEKPDATVNVSQDVIDQLSEDVMTLSMVPRSRWQTLLHLDVIKQRNKPKEPPKPPEKAPFFLPSLLKGVQPPSEQGKQGSAVTAVERSRISRMEKGGRSDFDKLLASGHDSGDYDPFLDHLKTLSPAASDLEIRSLSSVSPSTELVDFVSALSDRLRQKRDYELVQTWMAVFLKLHGDIVAEDESLLAALREWKAEQERESRRLGDLLGYCSGVVGFLRSGR